MTEPADSPSQPAPAPATEPADPDWFHQIEFDPKKGLDSVLPMALPDLAPPDRPTGHHRHELNG